LKRQDWWCNAFKFRTVSFPTYYYFLWLKGYVLAAWVGIFLIRVNFAKREIDKKQGRTL